MTSPDWAGWEMCHIFMLASQGKNKSRGFGMALSGAFC